jgi:uncharacterized protein (TIGR02145 family)
MDPVAFLSKYPEKGLTDKEYSCRELDFSRHPSFHGNSMKIGHLLFLCLLAFFLIWNACSSSGDEAGITATETRIYGRVLDSAGHAVSNVQVHLYQAASLLKHDTVALASTPTRDGKFLFTGMASGNYVLRALRDSSLLGFLEFSVREANPDSVADILVFPVIVQRFSIPGNASISSIWVDGMNAVAGISGDSIRLLSDGEGGQIIHLVTESENGSPDSLSYVVVISDSGAVLVPVDTESGSSSSYTGNASSSSAVILSSSSIASEGSSSSGTSVESSGSVLANSQICTFAQTSSDSGTLACAEKTYRTVSIGTQVWMAENLAYMPAAEVGPGAAYLVSGYDGTYSSGSSALEAAKSLSNYAVYGTLYSYTAALTACPSGWHLPDTTEWNTLVANAGGTSAGANLKAKDTLWYEGEGGGYEGTGTDIYGFSAFPGGYYEVPAYLELTFEGYWWSSTPAADTTAYGKNMSYSGGTVVSFTGPRCVGASVRCLKDP